MTVRERDLMGPPACWRGARNPPNQAPQPCGATASSQSNTRRSVPRRTVGRAAHRLKGQIGRPQKARTMLSTVARGVARLAIGYLSNQDPVRQAREV